MKYQQRRLAGLAHPVLTAHLSYSRPSTSWYGNAAKRGAAEKMPHEEILMCLTVIHHERYDLNGTG